MRTAIVATLVLTLVALAACGDDDDTVPASGSSTATAGLTSDTEQPSTTNDVTPTATPKRTSTGTPGAPPTALTDEMVEAISTWVAANDFLGARREMTDPRSCDDAVGDGPDAVQFFGKVCVLPQTFAIEGSDVIVRAGIWSSDGILDMVLEQVGGTWTVVEARPSDSGLQ